MYDGVGNHWYSLEYNKKSFDILSISRNLENLANSPKIIINIVILMAAQTGIIILTFERDNHTRGIWRDYRMNNWFENFFRKETSTWNIASIWSTCMNASYIWMVKQWYDDMLTTFSQTTDRYSQAEMFLHERKSWEN